MASRKKIPSDRPTERLPMNELDEPFVDSEPPTDVARETEPPSDLTSPTEPPPEAPTTSPELGYYICPKCKTIDLENCTVCMGMGVIDREAMKAFKKKETLQ